jgi:archaellum component FlaD/FlaE
MLENFAHMFSKNNTKTDDEPDTPDQLEGSLEPDVETTDDQPPEDDGPTVSELDVRLGDLEENVNSTESSLRALQSSQEEMAGSIEEMNDTVRQLVGVYDRLTAQDNPFVDDPTQNTDQATSDSACETTVAASDDTGDEDETSDEKFVWDEETYGHDHAAHSNGESSTDAEDDIVSFEDLKAEAAKESDTADEQREPEPTPTQPQETTTDQDGPVLASIPEGYAGDILIMEWLSGLVEQSGPAGALRAINHYENIGLISTEVKAYLVDVLGGPSLDVFVDPNQPHEPTAEDHAVSNGYLRVLDRIDDL